jgi:6-phosphogluconolactonase
MSEPDVLILPDPAAVAEAAAVRIVDGLAAGIAARGEAHWATTGGSTPAGIYDAIVGTDLRTAIAWDRVHLWLGDDRFVRRSDPRSNLRIADERLLGPAGVAIAAGHVHPVPTDAAIDAGRGPAAAAAAYAAEAAALAPAGRGGMPAFDVVVVGIGPDGHLLSVFPGSPAFDDARVVLPVPAPAHVEPHLERVTFNPAILDATPSLVVPILGAGKAPILRDVLGPDRDERRWPAQRARRAGAAWILDEAAAAGLALPD